MEKKETFGSKWLKLKEKIEEPFDERERDEAKRKCFFENVVKALERGTAQFSGDFFILIPIAYEIPFEDMKHFHYVPRQTPSSPEFNTILYFYDHKKDDLELWWSIPDEKKARFIYSDPLLAYSLDSKVAAGYETIKSYYNGTLDMRVSKYINAITKCTRRSNFNPKDFDDGHLVIQS